MNGTGPTIEIVKPFENGFELMKQILFRPFDLKKWFVIGFTAWLARIGSGGFNFNYNTRSGLRDDPHFQEFIDWLRQIPTPVVVTVVISLVVLVLVLAFVCAWLRARGRFMFTDNIVKNRAEVIAPWREYRFEGNSYFIFAVLVGCGFVLLILLLMVLFSLPFILPVFHGGKLAHQSNVYVLSMLVCWAAIIIVLVLAWAVIANIMVIIMYRHRCRAVEGFRRAISLINNYPGEITLFCLLSFAIGIGAIFAACIVMCATCCIAALPYIGTVILLPLWVWIRNFTLLFFRQFGPDYDVWAGQPPPNELPPPPQIPPPLPS